MSMSVLEGLLSCVYVCMFCISNCECELVCVRQRKHIESFDSTAFLSWRHLLPSPNLSVYQAKMLSKRLLRQLDNTTPPPPPQHVHHTDFLPSSQHPAAKPNNTQKRTQTHKKNTITHASSPTHPPSDFTLSAVLSWGNVAGTSKGLRYERGGFLKKGRRHNNRLNQTSTLHLLVIRLFKVCLPEDPAFLHRDTHTFSCQIVFAPRFTKWSSCQILQSWLPIKQKKAWSIKRHTVLTHFRMNVCRTRELPYVYLSKWLSEYCLRNNNLRHWTHLQINWKLKFSD